MQVPDPHPYPLDHLTLRGADTAPALVGKEGVLDFAGLEAAVGRLAASLRHQGLEPGARVASWLPKNRMTGLLPLAAARAGLIHVPINPLLKRMQVAHILADSGASLMISGRARIGTLEAGDLPSGCDPVGEEEGLALLEGKDALPPSKAAPDDLAACLHSGSTGRPRGSCQPRQSLAWGDHRRSYLRLGRDGCSRSCLSFELP